jgi:aryl-alcohol dehydrogenase-like predicted oxidoreductase
MNGPQDFTQKVSLGRTGIMTSRLGIGASYGPSREACLQAFDAGVNYFFWGSSRTVGMARALRDLSKGHRDELCVVLQVYARRPSLISRSIRKGLETLRMEYADVLLLGWHDDLPKERVLEGAEIERERGTFKHLAISSHHRPLFREILADGRYDAFHLRYNAAHIGAERDVFPHLPKAEEEGPGIVAFTCLRWGDLLNPKKMPPGEAPLTAADCYRFALSNPHVHVAITGPKDEGEMRHALGVLEAGPLDAEEMARVRAIGQHVYSQKSLADWLR